jgi:organic hydroperoxide reductase OsmC/OhrA
MPESASFTIHLEQERDYRFQVAFDWDTVARLTVDSGEPLGGAAGPDAERLLAAAVGNCLTASLLFCMRKFKQTPGPLRTRVTGTVGRNQNGRLRVQGLDVEIRLADTVADLRHFERCAAQFEDFCTVTQSIRHGIPVKVRVIDREGREVHAAA